MTQRPSKAALDLYHRGVAYEQNLDSASAFELYHAAIAEDPINPSALDALGRLLTERRNYRLARICFQRAINYVDEHSFYLHLAECERLDHRYREASEALARSTRLWDSPDWHVQRALVAYDQGDHFEALTACAAAFANQPTHARATWVSSLAKLASGNFKDGFEDYEARMKVQLTHFRSIPMQVWQDQPLTGKTLWVIAEQGLGDAIMFSRFIPDFMSDTVIDVHMELVSLFSDMFPFSTVRALGSPIPAANYFVPMGSLPFRMGRFDPYCPPYIDEPEMIVRSGFNVGICWAAGLHHERAHQKSMPFDHMLELLDVPDAQLISLQVGDEKHRLAEEHADCLIRDAAPYLNDMSDTVIAIVGLDLVITVDTAVAHLAGAMGKPCWVMLPYVCDWRWRFPGNGKTIWYDSVRLFQQESPGDWPGVMKRVVSALREEVSRRS